MVLERLVDLAPRLVEEEWVLLAGLKMVALELLMGVEEVALRGMSGRLMRQMHCELLARQVMAQCRWVLLAAVVRARMVAPLEGCRTCMDRTRRRLLGASKVGVMAAAEAWIVQEVVVLLLVEAAAVRLELMLAVLVEVRVVRSLELVALVQATLAVVERGQRVCVKRVGESVASCQSAAVVWASGLYLKPRTTAVSL